MNWRGRADRGVVEAIIATFNDSAEESHRRLSSLKYRGWLRTYHWLDASGMALYFLDRIEKLHIHSALPAATLARLRQNREDNRSRSAALFAEFVALNEAFQHAGVGYANLKGFTLSPMSCPNPELRCQLDLDFLIDGNQLELGRELLSKTGYVVAGTNNTAWEFTAGGSQLPKIEDYYKAKPQRSVELHFAASDTAPHRPLRDRRLSGLYLHSWNGVSFPALQPADQFAEQAFHLYRHISSAYTRVAWLLEYKNHISARYHDQLFWEEVRELSRVHPHASIAIGLANVLAACVFGSEAPPQLEEWTTDCLPAAVRLWADQYGRRSVLADFPGTKLYLLLQEELAKDSGGWQQKKRKTLLPLHRAPRIVQPRRGDNLATRLGGQLDQVRFLLFRFRFHLVEGLRYMSEAARWKRRLASLREYRPDPIID
jgi:Uncharacterised nucleotidyltransferase